MVVFVGSIDEFKVDFFYSFFFERSQQGLKNKDNYCSYRYLVYQWVDFVSYNLLYFFKSDNFFFGFYVVFFDYDKVLVDFFVMREVFYGSNGFVSWVIICGFVVFDDLM